MSGVCGRAEKSGVKQAAKTQSVSAQRPGGQGSAKDPEVGFGEAGSQTLRCGPFRLCGRRWVPGEARCLRLWGRALGGLRELCGQGQRWAAKQDHEGGVCVPADPAGCVDGGDPVGGGQPPVGLRVWLCDPGASWRLSLQTHWAGAHCLWAGLRGGRSGCALPRRVGGSPHQAPGARILHFWILHEREESAAQRGTHGLGASKEQIVCGHQQSIHVEVAQRVLLLLRGIRGGDVNKAAGGSCGLGSCATRSPQTCTTATGCHFSPSSL